MRIFLMTFLMLMLVSSSVAGSRDNFIHNVLPKKYPQLIRYLKENGTLPVTWISQTGESQKQTVELSEEGAVIIKTMMYGGPAANMNTPVEVIMVDRNQDSRLDYIEYLMEGQKPRSFSKPTNEGSLVLWDTALAITMKYSRCCQK